ncbi:MAG TPA: protein kinase [Kofleriaceae bacterium]|nr:protein kinase [Kofleriaceae bacterium]
MPEARDGNAPDQDPAIADTSSDPRQSVRGKGPRQVRAGDTLGRYDLGDELGEGGMATVFRARDRELRREVAVKVLFPHLARRSEVVRRFQREARAAAGLEHPNILRIYDVGGGEGDDPPYIVMELIRGRTLLAEIEQRGAMLAEVAACIGALLGDALAAAHAAGIIHRDVKPANVLIAPGGRLLLADFGVARLETEDSLVTRTGALLGTPAYMSPEQASGDVTTARSDVYSLGATLYQLATGSLPYSGSPAKVISLIAAGALVPPVRRRPSCGPDLSRLVERAMATDPTSRPQSATAFAAELRALAATGGLGDPTEELSAYFEDPEAFLHARTKAVVTAVVAAARSAITEARLPRAMALADRASALAPDDPGVNALVARVTEGGRLSRRNRALAVAGLSLALVGGGAALSWRMLSSSAGATALDARAPDAEPTIAQTQPSVPTVPEPPGVTPEPRDAQIDHAIDDTATDAAAIASRALDARVDPPRGGRASAAAPSTHAGRPSDAAVPLPSAAPVVPGPTAAIDAGAVAPTTTAPPLDAAVVPAVGHVIVQNPVWCEVWIDGKQRGILRNKPIEVPAGHHTVRCVNPAAGEWTQETDVLPGATQTLVGTVPDIAVRLDISATIDGKVYKRGAVVRLKPRRVEVVAGGKRQFITLRASCTLRDSPELECYQ